MERLFTLYRETRKSNDYLPNLADWKPLSHDKEKAEQRPYIHPDLLNRVGDV